MQVAKYLSSTSWLFFVVAKCPVPAEGVTGAHSSQNYRISTSSIYCWLSPFNPWMCKL